MKKNILSVILLLSCLTIIAQEAKDVTVGFKEGDLAVYGKSSFDKIGPGNDKVSALVLNTGVNYFVAKNVAIQSGVSLSFGEENDVKLSRFGADLGVLYYFTPASKFSVSFGANISYFASSLQSGSDPAQNSKQFAFNIPLGMNYFLSDSFAITSQWGGLGYSSNDNGNLPATDIISASVTMSNLNLGLLYKL